MLTLARNRAERCKASRDKRGRREEELEGGRGGRREREGAGKERGRERGRREEG